MRKYIALSLLKQASLLRSWSFTDFFYLFQLIREEYVPLGIQGCILIVHTSLGINHQCLLCEKLRFIKEQKVVAGEL